MTRGAIARRVARRAGIQVWRHRFQWLVAGVAVAGMGAATQVGAARMASSGADCADVVMQELATPSVAAARAAYGCLGDSYHSVLTEDAFVRQAQTAAPPVPARVTRTGETQTTTGERVVLFTLERNGQQVPYALYLNSEDRVERID